MSTQGEPKANEVGLEERVKQLLRGRLGGNGTYEEEDSSAEIHQALDSRLIEWVVDRVRVFVIAMVADPGRISTLIRGRWTTTTDQLELGNCIQSVITEHHKQSAHIAICLIEQGRR